MLHGAQISTNDNLLNEPRPFRFVVAVSDHRPYKALDHFSQGGWVNRSLFSHPPVVQGRLCLRPMIYPLAQIKELVSKF